MKRYPFLKWLNFLPEIRIEGLYKLVKFKKKTNSKIEIRCLSGKKNKIVNICRNVDTKHLPS